MVRDRRLLLLLVLDISAFMRGEKINRLNSWMELLKSDLCNEPGATNSVEIAVVTFGPVMVALPFTAADRLSLPLPVADTDAPMGEAIMKSLQLIHGRTEAHRSGGIPYWRPWMLLVGQGVSTDDTTAARTAIHEAQASKHLNVVAAGFEATDLTALERFSVNPAFQLEALRLPLLLMGLPLIPLVRKEREGTPQRAILASPGAWASSLA